MSVTMTVPYAKRLQHEPALLRRRPSPFQGRALGDRSRRMFLAITLLVFAIVGLIIWWTQATFTLVLGIEIGFLCGFVFTLVVAFSFWMPWHRREAVHAPINQSAMTVTLDENGVHARNAVLDQTVIWPGLIGITETKAAIGLWYGRASLMILPDDCLPQGVTHVALMDRIADWRAAR